MLWARFPSQRQWAIEGSASAERDRHPGATHRSCNTHQMMTPGLPAAAALSEKFRPWSGGA
jgi:hypothetical protein